MQVAISKPPIVTGLDSRQEPVSTTPIGSKKELNGKELVEGTRICTLFAQVTNLLDSYVEHAKNLESNRPIGKSSFNTIIQFNFVSFRGGASQTNERKHHHFEDVSNLECLSQYSSRRR